MTEKGVEAVHRQAVGSLAQGLFPPDRSRRLRGSHGIALVTVVPPVLILEEDWRPSLPHMPLQVVGERAQEDVGADAIGNPVIDGPDLEIDPLQAAEGALHLGKSLVVPDRVFCRETFLRLAGPHDVDPIQDLLEANGFLTARPPERVLFDGPVEVLSHLEATDHSPDLDPDLILAQGSLRPA